MNVPLIDLKAQYATLRAEMRPAIDAVLESQQFINGPAVKELEGLVAAYCDCPAAVGVSSGTDAILCALMALNIREGDEVITTPFTFFATAGCIVRTGAKPVFVDIDPVTYNLDPALIEKAITPRTRAILPVHLYGQLADMDAINAIAAKHKLAVVEDACQAIGATQNGRKAGSIGTVGCFSFFPTKNLGGLGDGGMVVTTDAALGQTMALLRDHGQNPRYYYRMIGGNFRLDTLQAAGLVVKMEYLESWSAKRRAHAARYDELLADVPSVTTPKIAPGNVCIFHQYVVRVPRRDACQKFLADAGIGSAVYYPLCLHEQECFKSLGFRKGDFPESEKAAADVLALPVYPELADEQIVYVAGKIREFCGNSCR